MPASGSGLTQARAQHDKEPTRLAVQQGRHERKALVLPVQQAVEARPPLREYLHGRTGERCHRRDARRCGRPDAAGATQRTDREYAAAAFRLGMSRSAATSSKKVGRAEPSPPTVTKDILLDAACYAPRSARHSYSASVCASMRAAAGLYGLLLVAASCQAGQEEQ